MAGSKVSADDCVMVLKALGDDSRWRMVQALLKQTLSVSELGERLDIPQYNVSKHLGILREAGIVVSEREGKAMMCSISPGFRDQLARGGSRLDFGCCAFDFSRGKG